MQARRARAQRLTASVSVTGDQSGPPARWGASYGQQFAILFARSVKVCTHPASLPLLPAALGIFGARLAVLRV